MGLIRTAIKIILCACVSEPLVFSLTLTANQGKFSPSCVQHSLFVLLLSFYLFVWLLVGSISCLCSRKYLFFCLSICMWVMSDISYCKSLLESSLSAVHNLIYFPYFRLFLFPLISYCVIPFVVVSRLMRYLGKSQGTIGVPKFNKRGQVIMVK